MPPLVGVSMGGRAPSRRSGEYHLTDAPERWETPGGKLRPFDDDKRLAGTVVAWSAARTLISRTAPEHPLAPVERMQDGRECPGRVAGVNFPLPPPPPSRLTRSRCSAGAWHLPPTTTREGATYRPSRIRVPDKIATCSAAADRGKLENDLEATRLWQLLT